MVNGTSTKYIKIKRSFRQYCLLSMIVYILSVEPLLFKISQNNLIKGIKIPKCGKEINQSNMQDVTSVKTDDTSYMHTLIHKKIFEIR